MSATKIILSIGSKILQGGVKHLTRQHVRDSCFDGAAKEITVSGRGLVKRKIEYILREICRRKRENIFWRETGTIYLAFPQLNKAF